MVISVIHQRTRPGTGRKGANGVGRNRAAVRIVPAGERRAPCAGDRARRKVLR